MLEEIAKFFIKLTGIAVWAGVFPHFTVLIVSNISETESSALRALRSSWTKVGRSQLSERFLTARSSFKDLEEYSSS